MKKLFKIMMVLMICLFVGYHPIYAVADPIEDPDTYKPIYNMESNNTKLIQRGNTVLGVIRFVGSFAAVITLMVIGIRYMFASTADKASYKETMVPYIIGAIMVFAIPNIIGIIYDIVTAILI